MAKKETPHYWQVVSQGMDVEDAKLRLFVRHKTSLGIGRESILRNVLIEHTPEPYRVRTGFIAVPAEELLTSAQCDILVYNPMINQALYRIEEFVVISPDVARLQSRFVPSLPSGNTRARSMV